MGIDFVRLAEIEIITCTLQTNTYLGTEDLLRDEPEEGLEMVQDSIKVCRSFMECYATKKSDIGRHFEPDVPVVQWSFNNELIFARLNVYIERLSIVKVWIVYV